MAGRRSYHKSGGLTGAGRARTIGGIDMADDAAPWRRPRVWVAAGLAGALLLVTALLLERAFAVVNWEVGLEYHDDLHEYLPRYTLHLEEGQTAGLDLFWTGHAAAEAVLHVRTDDGACIGERAIRLEPPQGRLALDVRAAAAGPHTFVWSTAPGAAPARIFLRVWRGRPLPVWPAGVAVVLFVAAGVGGLAVGARSRGAIPEEPARRRRDAFAGALVGILLALGVLLVVKAAHRPLDLRADGPVETP
jgi:hypothetical protein